MCCGLYSFSERSALEMQFIVMNQTKQLENFCFQKFRLAKERERSSGKDAVE
jgi:hypothetical protein